MTGTLFQNSDSSAVISPDGLYRYRLDRQWDPAVGASVLWVMLNPSTADAEINDRTMDRVISFSLRFGFRRLQVVNLFAYRATKPRALLTADDPIGPENDAAIALAAQQTSAVVCAWGANPRYRQRAEQVVAILDANASSKSYQCLGKTKDGHPRHPLYVRGDAELQPFWLPAHAR